MTLAIATLAYQIFLWASRIVCFFFSFLSCPRIGIEKQKQKHKKHCSTETLIHLQLETANFGLGFNFVLVFKCDKARR